MVDRKLFKFLTFKMVPSVLNALVLRHQLLITQLLLSYYLDSVVVFQKVSHCLAFEHPCKIDQSLQH